MTCCIDNGGMWGQCIKYSEACLRHQAESNQITGQHFLIGLLVLGIGFAVITLVLLLFQNQRKEKK